MSYLLPLILLACRVESKPEPSPDSGAPDSACTASDWYQDGDGDGFGVGGALSACEQPPGTVAVAGDCNDADATVYPDALVACTSGDGNCDGIADDADADGDHFLGCEECDDSDATAYPGAVELCDGVDNDCDLSTDEDDAVDARAWYTDGDGDGFGAGTAIISCEAPVGAVAFGGDCDDLRAATFPGAEELCNNVDDDCDLSTDEDDATDAVTWNIDYDGDGYGSSAYTTTSCEAPAGWVADATDCLDTNADAHPGAVEACNAIDDDCDGTTDEDDAEDAVTWYLDADADGYGAADVSTLACAIPGGYAATDDDCDDGDDTISPGATESCDGVDEDCDGTADNGAGGSDVTCAARSCEAILEEGASVGDGVYWLDPDGDGDTSDAWQAYCDMTADGGGWTRLYSSLWPYWWDRSDWEDVGTAEDDVYSRLGERADFADGSGVTTWRFDVGNSGTWNTGTRAHYTVWSQAHDAFTDTTDGSDYIYIEGAESTTCSGFNGLHDKLYDSLGTYSLSSDVDSGDGVNCWWMQIVPLTQYVDAVSYPGYLEGYGGPNTHVWQELWVR